eukprot:GHVP01004505.1.p1 GENE.GHVP01004505.1~~GHVP01004505.1.p1  ORF type:complete len:484 (-),score=35.31 GHVP01004505.1:1294-2745(-)
MYNKYPLEINPLNIVEHSRRKTQIMERTPPKSKATMEPIRRSSSPPVINNQPPPSRRIPISQDDYTDSEFQYEEPNEAMPNLQPDLQHTQHPTFKSSYNSSPSNPYLLLTDPISTNSSHAHTQVTNGVRTRSSGLTTGAPPPPHALRLTMDFIKTLPPPALTSLIQLHNSLHAHFQILVPTYQLTSGQLASLLNYTYSHLTQQLSTQQQARLQPIHSLTLQNILISIADGLDPRCYLRIQRLNHFRPISSNLITSISAFANLAITTLYSKHPPTTSQIYQSFHLAYLTTNPALELLLATQHLENLSETLSPSQMASQIQLLTTHKFLLNLQPPNTPTYNPRPAPRPPQPRPRPQNAFRPPGTPSTSLYPLHNPTDHARPFTQPIPLPPNSTNTTTNNELHPHIRQAVEHITRAIIRRYKMETAKNELKEKMASEIITILGLMFLCSPGHLNQIKDRIHQTLQRRNIPPELAPFDLVLVITNFL